jgi:flagellar hook-associated protein 3 FlgL
MRISSLSFTNQFLSQIGNLQAQENQLQGQASSQLSFSQAEENPQAIESVLNLQTQSAANTQYISNITKLLSTANLTYSHLSSVHTELTQAATIASNATNGTNSSPTQLDGYAKTIGSYIDSILQSANTKDSDGNYIFGGTKDDQAPFVATKDASGNYISISYRGSTSTAQVAIGENYSLSAQVPGANTTATGATGAFVDSRAGVDVFNNLISLQQHLLAHDTATISSQDVKNLNAAGEHFINQVASNGILQSALNTAQDAAASSNASIATEISSKTSADLATTLTQLTRTQTAYQAALSSATKIFNVSLLDYLR